MPWAFRERRSRHTSRSEAPRGKGKIQFQDYFLGPRDVRRHSKWPRALRMHGSVFPKLALPCCGIAIWSSMITCISELVHPISVHPIVLTVLGIVVGLALNFRSATAYERYSEGRKMWAYLSATSQNLARVFWVHTRVREGEKGKEDLIGKITCLNLIVAFAIALKHRLRFEPYIQYDDLHDLVQHLNTTARHAGSPTVEKPNSCRRIAEMLRIPMAKSNPRKELKRAKRPVGNLPLEILSYISAYTSEVCSNKTFELGIAQTHALNNMESLNEILAHTDRVLNTPLPVAYAIAISQITWLYVITLPFQLVNILNWLTIPVTTIAAYIILGIAAIGHEIENPFGCEVNDLPMEEFCAQIASDITIIASRPPATFSEYITTPGNRPLYPLSTEGYDFWMSRDISEIYDALNTRATISDHAITRRQSTFVAHELERHRRRFSSHTLSMVCESHGEMPKACRKDTLHLASHSMEESVSPGTTISPTSPWMQGDEVDCEKGCARGTTSGEDGSTRSHR